MKYREKLELVIRTIRDASKIKRVDRYVQLYSPSSLDFLEFYDFLKFMEQEGIILIAPPFKNRSHKTSINNIVLIEISNTFNKWVENKLEEEVLEEKVHWIRFSESDGKILLDDKYLLRTLNFDGENSNVFSFLFLNPNISHTLAEIEKKAEIKILKKLNKIVENLGFKEEIRKMFFSVGKDSICFHNPISKNRLRELGLQNYTIPDEYKS